MAWAGRMPLKAVSWARLGDGNHALALLVRKALFPVTSQEIRYDKGGGVYANMFDASPPFQIDANLWRAGGHQPKCCSNRERTKIELLPALPDAWKNGEEFPGLRARGGFQVDTQRWRDGEN